MINVEVGKGKEAEKVKSVAEKRPVSRNAVSEGLEGQPVTDEMSRDDVLIMLW